MLDMISMADTTVRTEKSDHVGTSTGRGATEVLCEDKTHRNAGSQPPARGASFYRGPFFHGSDYRLTPLVLGLLIGLSAQATWWAAVLYGNFAASMALLLQLSLQLLLQRFVRAVQFDTVKFALVVTGSGLLLDAVTVATGAASFRDGALIGIPLWLVLLWLSFALSLPGLWQWLTRQRQQMLSLAIAGPLAYLAGAQLGAVSIVRPGLYAVLLLSGWLLLPWIWCGYWQRLQATRETVDVTNQH